MRFLRSFISASALSAFTCAARTAAAASFVAAAAAPTLASATIVEALALSSLPCAAGLILRPFPFVRAKRLASALASAFGSSFDPHDRRFAGALSDPRARHAPNCGEYTTSSRRRCPSRSPSIFSKISVPVPAPKRGRRSGQSPFCSIDRSLDRTAGVTISISAFSRVRLRSVSSRSNTLFASSSCRSHPTRRHAGRAPAPAT